MQANPYDVTFRLPSGQEEVVRVYAYNAIDAMVQAHISVDVRYPGDDCALLSIGPPPELCETGVARWLRKAFAG